MDVRMSRLEGLSVKMPQMRSNNRADRNLHHLTFLCLPKGVTQISDRLGRPDGRGNMQAVSGEGKMHGRNGFSMPPWQGHFSMCGHVLRYQDMVIASGDQDSFLRAETSEHALGFTSTHDGPLSARSTEFQVCEQQGLFHTKMVVKPLCTHKLGRTLRNIFPSTFLS